MRYATKTCSDLSRWVKDKEGAKLPVYSCKGRIINFYQLSHTLTTLSI